MMVALWAAVTFRRPMRGGRSRKRTRAMRVQARSVTTLSALDHARHDLVLDPRVQPLGVLAHDHEVDVLDSASRRPAGSHRPEARVEVERVAQAHVDALESLADRAC